MVDILITGMLASILFFVFLNFIFQDILADNTAGIRGCIVHDLPIWNQTFIYNEQCTLVGANSTITRSEPYETQTWVLWAIDFDFFDGENDDCVGNTTSCWIAEFPSGWLNFAGDTFQVLSDKGIGQLGLVFLTMALPAVIEDLSFLWVINIPAYIFIAGGIYKMVSPFV